MSWRIIKITTHSEISLKTNCLCYENMDTNEILNFPLEEISVLILESMQINITSALLSAIVDNGISVIIFNQKYKPNGIILPYGKPLKQTETIFAQIKTTTILNKRIWQKIIKSKINNQAFVLEYYEKKQADKLKKIALNVNSGDSKNNESFAAQIYWNSLFGENFIRHAEDITNATLNYGYAIIRNVIIENIAISGLISSLGVHHHSVLNPFNLADDLIEPYRAFVDNKVASMNLSIYDTTVNKEQKEILISILQNKCILSGQEISILNAIPQTIYSFISAIKENDENKLNLPEFIKYGK